MLNVAILVVQLALISLFATAILCAIFPRLSEAGAKAFEKHKAFRIFFAVWIILALVAIIEACTHIHVEFIP